MARRGAQKGNQNARKHGFYSRVTDEACRQHVRAVAGLEGLDAETAIVRLKLRQLMKDYPDRLDLHLAAIGAIARLARRRHNLTAGPSRPSPAPPSPDSPSPGIPPTHAGSHRTGAQHKAGGEDSFARKKISPKNSVPCVRSCLAGSGKKQ